MPKSKKRRDKKKDQKSAKPSKSEEVDTKLLDNSYDGVEIPNNIDIDLNSNSESNSSSISDTEFENSNHDAAVDPSDEGDYEINNDIESELKRLKEEYQRQKQITQELERERDRIQLEGQSRNRLEPKSSSHQLGGNIGIAKSSDSIIDISMEPQLQAQSDMELDRRVADNIETLKTELVNIQEIVDSKLDKSSFDEFETEKKIIDEFADKIDHFDREIQRMGKMIKRTDEKLDAVLLDIGFEESLNINKVPNYILVLVYETILNDIINRIKHVIGGPDTENAVNEIIENVRSHTSGGELFKYEHNEIRIPELKQYLDNKMISPKQIHLTFNSILNRLIEYVPDYVPKNFKAMIKIMSQEYSVEKVTELETHFENLKEDFAEIQGNINKFLSKYKDRRVDQQFQEEEIKSFNKHLLRLTERFDELPETIEKQIENLLEAKLDQNIAKLDIDSTKKLKTIEKKDDDSEQPIFSSGIIELGDEPIKDEKEKDDGAEMETQDKLDTPLKPNSESTAKLKSKSQPKTEPDAEPESKSKTKKTDKSE